MKHKLFVLILIVIIIPLVFLLNATPLYSVIRDIAISIVRPIVDALNFFFYNLTQGIDRLLNYAELSRLNEALQEKIIALERAGIDIAELNKENERLRHLLSFKESIEYKHISAQLIGRDVSLWSNWIVIDSGYHDGIVKDMPIVAPGGLVGKSVSVGNATARAILIIDRNSKVSALIQQSREIGIVEGTGDGFLILRYLPLNASARIGDTVLTSGYGGIYPKGIPIGTITIIGTERNGLHLFAKIKPFVDFARIEEILCLKKQTSE